MWVGVEFSSSGWIMKRPSGLLDMDSIADVGDRDPPKWLSNWV